MDLCKVTVQSSEHVAFTIATIAIERIMQWDFFRAHRFCQEAGENGSSVLCIAPKAKALQYVQELEEHCLSATCVPI